MRANILCAALMMISLQRQVYAQGSYLTQHPKEDRLFNVYPPIVNHVHTAYLLKDEKMIVELADLTDYDMLVPLDSVIGVLMHDIEFYKDSLPATGSVRIDYELTEGSGQKMMRFRKYAPQGDLFVKQNNETAALKLDQDTVHIILKKKPLDRSELSHFYDWPVQVTFCLNNYTDIDTLLKDKGLITALIDTLSKAIPRKKNIQERKYPYDMSQSTVDYYPYRKDGKMYTNNILMPHGPLMEPAYSNRYNFKVNAQIGAGVVGNTLSPMADIGLQYNKFWGWESTDVSILRLSATPYYLFDKDQQSNYLVHDNWFVNAAIGSIYDHPQALWPGNKVDIGAGYLVIEKGSYFRKNTFKIFTDLQIAKGITIVPEVIATDNCKQLFPGITVKFF